MSKPFREWETYHKVGTGLGITGLGMGITNFVHSHRQAESEKHRLAVEQKSLAALQKIHKALSVKPTGI